MPVPQRVEVVAREGDEIITTLDTIDFSTKAFDLMMDGLYAKVDHERHYIREVA